MTNATITATSNGAGEPSLKVRSVSDKGFVERLLNAVSGIEPLPPAEPTREMNSQEVCLGEIGDPTVKRLYAWLEHLRTSEAGPGGMKALARELALAHRLLEGRLHECFPEADEGGYSSLGLRKGWKVVALLYG